MAVYGVKMREIYSINRQAVTVGVIDKSPEVIIEVYTERNINRFRKIIIHFMIVLQI